MPTYQEVLNDIILKKFQTSPFTETTASIAAEKSGTSSFKIQSGNIYSEPIPGIAPTDLSGNISTVINPEGDEETGTDGTYQTSVSYPYIFKYTKVKMLPISSDGRTFAYAGTTLANIVNTNVLIDAIPGNQSPDLSYQITVYENGNVTTKNYFFDTSSGYVTFFTSISSDNMRITFWRYKGKKGLNNIVGDLAVTGEVSATSFNATSDVRLKKEIKPLENSLEKICSLQGVEFEFINDLIQRKNIGFIAQDIEKIIPQVVTTSEKGEQYKSVAYGNIVALLVEAIKELREEIETLKNK
jgi:hypothetical protein